ncbi:MAG: sugar ABC transporter ATP-binding protein [Spirochaetaceae bacterium]|jgi:ribose transport system ATP-binding protein|nr:sugar ABC transporter ATP-binding protein [Spirochaetaceae bacterium]
MLSKIVSIKNLVKQYPGVRALDDLSIDFYEGEVHALLGENGAGKSTLIKIIAGAITPDSGTLEFADGIVHTGMTPQKAKEYGVEVIYQEFNLVGCLTVAENICFGERYGHFVNKKHMREVAKSAFELFEIDIDPAAAVYELPSSKQQIVEISRAIFRKAKLLIMDEPSAPLSVAEVEKMFQVIRRLKQQGVSIIYISHRMEELFAISDKVTIMRDGKYVATMETAKTTRKELVNCMVGRELKEVFPAKQPRRDEVLLRVDGLCGNGDEDISLEVHRGEILGLGGLVGAGRTELVRLIYGADKIQSGKVFVDGQQVKIKSPAGGIKSGIGMIPEDRKRHGCLLTRSIRVNTTLSSIRNISKLCFVSGKKEKAITEEYIRRLKTKTPSMEQMVGNLSGGNQQKVVIAKTLSANCHVIIFDEPTRGIDVGAKQEIYKLIVSLAEEGNGIILVSSEMEELLGLSDRILVLYKGKIAGELSKEEATQAKILDIASGGSGSFAHGQKEMEV